MFPFINRSGINVHTKNSRIYVPPAIIETQKQKEKSEEEERQRIVNEQEQSLLNINITEVDNSKQRIPSFKSFHMQKNKLEAVVLLTTSYEIVNGTFSKFIKMLLGTMYKPYNIEFIISTNNGNYTSIQKEVSQLKNYFSNVEVLNIEISPKNDIYKIEDLNETDIPKYGLTSGPNILFWDTMKYMKKYNTTLVLEADCILYQSWLDTLINYVEYCGDFLISGSTYTGNYKISSSMSNGFFHINGVALYKTGSPVFHYILEELTTYISCEVKRGHLISAYDYMLTKMILEKLYDTKNKYFDFWKVVYRYIIKNTFIINASMKSDKNDSQTKYLELYPRCVILHKKLAI